MTYLLKAKPWLSPINWGVQAVPGARVGDHSYIYYKCIPLLEYFIAPQYHTPGRICRFRLSQIHATYFHLHTFAYSMRVKMYCIFWGQHLVRMQVFVLKSGKGSRMRYCILEKNPNCTCPLKWEHFNPWCLRQLKNKTTCLLNCNP